MIKPPKSIIFIFRRKIFGLPGFDNTILKAGVFDIVSYGVDSGAVYRIREDIVDDQYYYTLRFDDTLEENIMLLRMRFPSVPLIRFTEFIYAACPDIITLDFSSIPEVDPIEFLKLKPYKKACMLI